MITDYLLIIGAMKCGTTSLFDDLAQHPQIAPSRDKEPGFFAFEEAYGRGFAWYESLFDFDNGRHRYAMEASTDYSKFPYCSSVAARLAAARPRNFKLIYMMRHPLRRIESHARHTQRTRKEVGQIVSDRPGHSLDDGVSAVSLAVSDYAAQIDQFAEYHKSGDLLLLTLEEYSASRDAVMERVISFLNLDPAFRMPTVERRNEAGSHVRVRPLWSHLTSFRPGMAAAKSLLPKRARQAIKNAVALTPQRVEGRFELSAVEEAKLLAHLKPGLRRLASVYGVDVERVWGIEL